MTAEPHDENIILLDDPDLLQEVTTLISSSAKGKVQGVDFKATPLPSGGTGFTSSRRFRVNDAVFNFLLLSPDNAQPFAYLTLGQRSLKRKVPLVLTVAGAQSLDHELYPGDIALVSEAVALPYPAMYTNAPAKDPERPGVAQDGKAEVYRAAPEVLADFMALGAERTIPQTWQKSLTSIRTGYAKHPTWRGGLDPWAPEQLDSLKDAGLSTISQTPAGVYEVRPLCPDSRMICFNMIKGRAEDENNAEWERRKKSLLYPAMRLIVDVVSGYGAAQISAD